MQQVDEARAITIKKEEDVKQNKIKKSVYKKRKATREKGTAAA